MSYHCHPILEFLDVNAWIWTNSIHHPCVFKLLEVLFCHDGHFIFLIFTTRCCIFVSSSLKTIKTTLFVLISSLCIALHFRFIFSFQARRLKLSANYSVRSSIALECLHLDIVVMLSSLFLACLFTSLFWKLYNGVFKHLSQLHFFAMISSLIIPCWLIPL
jgi:hypothetical protein